MIIGTAKIKIIFPESYSLKAKRSVLQSIIKRIQNKFNAAVAEVEDQDLWQKGTIAIVVIGGDTRHADSQLNRIIEFVYSEPRIVVSSVETEIL